MDNTSQLRRWRLIMGKEIEAEKAFSSLSLSEEDMLMDSALAEIYGLTGSASSKNSGSGASAPHLTKWLGDLRSLFSPMEIKIIQNDAIERRGMKQLLFEPEMLDQLEPDISTAALLLTLKNQIPTKAKDNARQYIAKIVEEIERRLADDIKRSVTAALNRREHSHIPSANALDYKTTLRRSLKNYDPKRNMIIPERFWFFERTAKSGARTVILDIDQSGSMAESAIYSSILGCILASMSSLTTHIVAFDTSVTDLTEMCHDPVELLYGIQLGGGTDINNSVAYCEGLITEPDKTTLFLITDLYEGGNRAQLERRLEDLAASGVNVIVLLAISDNGSPCYDTSFAEKIASYGIPCAACPPDKLPVLLEAVIKRRNLSCLLNNHDV